ncbi:hypothetical protein LGL55_25040 [Clostridium tagluense]|uniref:hypothetical protein n=3 Tax=Clostridium tagluense TaxID=360422 RepID=UPI001CF27F9C|nr:hypothetical protein [Clostridium tagluense]MCB2324041.1 hypothetical protein [Clostridium tagluense]MCB2338636.1 hypothetical protein [Clostridium tagluense]MCB2367430.1 hypothetical protein [Clostridium tagluense]
MYKTCPNNFNTPMYLSPYDIYRMYSCPSCVHAPMYNRNFSRQLSNYANDADGNIKDFISTLEERDFIVQEGKLKYVDILKLVSEGIIDTGFANNAGAPYASYLLPPAPNQDPSPAQKPPKGYNPQGTNNYPANIEYTAPGLDYKLRADEAIVLIGKTPPPAYNFSYRSYLGFVENEPSKDYSDTITAGNSSTGFYHNIGASMGDQINNHNIWTDNTPYGNPGNPFNSSTIIITTADRGINTQMHGALVNSGFNPGIINDDNIPMTLTNIGLEKGKDTFSFIMRAAIWLDYDAGWDYINNLENYVKVLRITPKTTYPYLNPWPIPTLKTHETGTTEFQVVPYARNELNYLRNEIIKKYQNEEYEPVDLDSKLWILDGYEGILQDFPVYYDNRDGLYIRPDNFKLKTDEDFVILYGVDHVQTGFATFFNISFYGEEYWNGVVGANTTDELKYPATEYFPKDYKNSKYYYAVKMARKTEEGNEFIIPYSTGNPKGSAYGVDNNEDAYVGFRIYANPETNVAPAIFDTIWSRAILFRKKKKQ